MSALAWPWQIRPLAVWSLAGASQGGGQPALNGTSQVTRSHAGFWVCRMRLSLAYAPQVLPWTAFKLALDGRAGEALIPAFGLHRARGIDGGMQGFCAAAGIGDVTTHDHAGWGQTSDPILFAAAAASAGATRITVTAPAPWTVPQPGMAFGIGERLYQVAAAWQEEAGDPWTIAFRPTLREAVAEGDPIITDRPVCRMRLADDGGANPDMQTHFAGTVSPVWEEAF